MKTYKQLQDEVLESMGDAQDEGTLRSLVKTHLQRVHQKVLTQDQWDFMLWPRTESFTTTINQKTYNLHPEFFQPLYFFDTVGKEYLEVVPVKQTVEVGEDIYEGTAEVPDRIQINSIVGVQGQPTTAAVVTVTTTGGVESATNSLVVRGIVDDMVQEETLSSASSWSTISGSLAFSHIISITKVGNSWSRKITVTCDSTTVLVLLASEWAKQYQQVEFFVNPSSASAIYYRFYRKPRTLTLDNDATEVPSEFDDLLVLRAKLKMTGFSRADANEINEWRETESELMNQLRQTYQQSRALNSRPRYVTYVQR